MQPPNTKPAASYTGESLDRAVLADRLAGLLLGQAVGDAIGLPREAMNPRRAARVFGQPPLRHRLLLGRGMCSDDTEHACMTAAAFLRGRGDPTRFAKALGWQLRGWFLSLPAGLGMATARSCAKLCLGIPPSHSGVWSAGNGPAMRAPIIGAALAGNLELLRQFVRSSTRLTHTDPRAEEGALAVALGSAYAMRHGNRIDAQAFLDHLLAQVSGDQLRQHLELVRKLLAEQGTPERLAEALGLSQGVTGYINHTVPVVLFCWLRHLGDFRRTVEAVVMLGGDADTTGAIAGGLAGATVGESGIPEDWLRGICEWPRTLGYVRRLARCVAEQAAGAEKGRVPRWFWPGVVPRNILFLLVVLGHGVRRLFPPY